MEVQFQFVILLYTSLRFHLQRYNVLKFDRPSEKGFNFLATIFVSISWFKFSNEWVSILEKFRLAMQIHVKWVSFLFLHTHQWQIRVYTFISYARSSTRKQRKTLNLVPSKRFSVEVFCFRGVNRAMTETAWALTQKFSNFSGGIGHIGKNSSKHV